MADEHCLRALSSELNPESTQVVLGVIDNARLVELSVDDIYQFPLSNWHRSEFLPIISTLNRPGLSLNA